MTEAGRALGLVLALGILTGIGTAALRAHEQQATASAARADARVGAVIFATDCETCHGVGGDGAGGAPALNDGKVLKTYPTGPALQAFIRKNMPASDPGILTPGQVRDLADFVLSLNRRLP